MLDVTLGIGQRNLISILDKTVKKDYAFYLFDANKKVKKINKIN